MLRAHLATVASTVSNLTRRWLGQDAGELVRLVADALARYKLRTALSVLGIVLGIAAVIAMLSVGEGARQETLRQVEALGLENILVRYRGFSAVPPQKGSTGLTLGDAARLKRLVPMTGRVEPLVQRYVQISGPLRSRPGMVLGVTDGYQAILGLRQGRGRLLAGLDDDPSAKVCVLGAGVSRALFGYQDPLGQLVHVGEGWYRVVGVLADRTVSVGGAGSLPLPVRDLNQTVLVPLSALVGHPLESDPWQRVDEIWIRVVDGQRVDELGRAVGHMLARTHRGVPDYDVVVPRELLDQSLRVQRTFAVVIGSIAAIALLVGGIGIMNIMLASVLERTAEIGLRRAVGASRRDVIAQFLTESLALTVAGGVIGILVGTGVSWAITAYAGWATHVSVWAVVLAVIVSCGVGLVFGSFPAARAAALQPIDAVRYE